MVDGPSDWPSEFSQLKHIDNLLRCSICFEFLNIAMIVPSCSHNYCSYCIRKHIYGKESCPTCHVPLISGDLKCNRILDELVSYFKPVRERLINVLRDYINRNQICKEKTQNKSGKEKRKSTRIVSDEDSEFEEIQNFRSPNTSVDKPRNEKTKQLEMTKCPSCHRDVPLEAINVHLDVCLRDVNSTKSPCLVSNKNMKHITSCCLDALKDCELKSKAKQYGLPSHGDPKQLKKRIENFILLHNSQCDSASPVSVSEIIKKVCENEEKIAKCGYTPGVVIPTHDNSYSISEKENMNKEYGKANEKQNENLIKEVKGRCEGKESYEVIEIDSTSPVKHFEINDQIESEFGHVPDWFDRDLLPQDNIKKNQGTLNETGKTKKSKKSTKVKNKKNEGGKKKNIVQSGNIAKYFCQKKNVEDENKNEVKTVEIDLTKTGCSLIDDEGKVNQPDLQSPSLSLCEDTDDDDISDNEDVIVPISENVIYETDDEDGDKIESPLKIQEDPIHESASVKRKLRYHATERLNSTVAVKDSRIKDFTIPLSPVGKRKTLRRKRCQTEHDSQPVFSETFNDSFHNSPDDHGSELSGEISKLVDQVIDDPLCFSDSEDGCNNLFSNKNSSNPVQDAIPLPPNDDTFEIEN